MTTDDQALRKRAIEIFDTVSPHSSMRNHAIGAMLQYAAEVRAAETARCAKVCRDKGLASNESYAIRMATVCAEAIERTAGKPPRIAHSKTEFKRLTTQGVDVLPPVADDGAVRVPREPTEKILDAMHKADDDYSNCRFGSQGSLSRGEFVYKAMIAASEENENVR